MAVLLALIPIMMIFICLFVFRQTSLKASLISYAVCCGIVLLTPMFRLQMGEIVHATIKGGLICFIVGYVLFFGIFLFHLMNKMGYINQVARFIEHVTHDRLLQMLLMCFGICPLIESVSGFGIGFMVAALFFFRSVINRFKQSYYRLSVYWLVHGERWQPERLLGHSLSVCRSQKWG